MTRHAAQRWLVLVISLLGAFWLGQGVASAYTMGVNPQSGPPGTSVTVTLKEFLAACVVLFDNVPVAAANDGNPVVGCEDTSVTFAIPGDVIAGNHEIRAIGQGGEGEIAEQALTFRVTAGAAVTPSSTPSAIAGVPPVAEEPAAPTTVSGNAALPAGATATVARRATTTASPTSSAVTSPAVTSAPAAFAASCPPRQVALTRFEVAPTHARPAAKVRATTTWGAVGSCTEVRALQALLDGEAIGTALPEAGIIESFELTVPDDAKGGRHRLSLVAAGDQSVEIASLTFDVERPASSPGRLIVGMIAAGAVLLSALFLAFRRRRWRKAFVHDISDPEDDWGGVLDGPDPAVPPAEVSGLHLATDVTMAGATLAGAAEAVAVMAEEDDPTMPVVPLVVTSGRDGSYYLLERQNPHAPRQSNGKRGWYRTQRLAPVRGIVARTTDPHTAGAAASELATGELAGSAHVVIDIDGALDLLPDDIVAVHGPGTDDPALEDAVLVMLLAGFGADHATDELILGHAGSWLATKMTAHGIPARLVTRAELVGGEAGLLSDGTGFPWPRMVSLVTQPSVAAPPEQFAAPEPESYDTRLIPLEALSPEFVAAPPPDVTPPGQDVAAPPAEPVAPVGAPTISAVSDQQVVGAPQSSAAPLSSALSEVSSPPQVAVPSQVAESFARAFEADVVGAPGMPAELPVVPVDPPVASVVDLPVVPAPGPARAESARAEATAPDPRSARTLPTPDELIAQATAGSASYLLEHENAHATLRANGKKGWYYPTRYGGIRAVVLHHLEGGDTAEAVAEWLAAIDRPQAAHAIVDRNTILGLLPDDATALHGVRSSSAALDLALVFDPTQWGTDPPAEEAVLVRAATWTGVRAVRYRIPVRRITIDDWRKGLGGIAATAEIDGPDFPWDRFLQLTAWVARRVAAAQAPGTGAPVTGPTETVRSGSQPI